MDMLVPSVAMFQNALAEHYTDFSPEKLKEIYDKANIKVLN